ncbi:MAG: hypothetical protein RR280_04435 [Bacteroidaceae bacterium]
MNNMYRVFARNSTTAPSMPAFGIVMLLEVDEGLSKPSSPKPFEIAAQACQEIFGDIPLYIHISPADLDNIDKLLKQCDYHTVAGLELQVSEGGSVVYTNVSSKHNAGRGIEIGVRHPTSDMLRRGKVLSLKEACKVDAAFLMQSSLVIIKDY